MIKTDEPVKLMPLIMLSVYFTILKIRVKMFFS